MKENQTTVIAKKGQVLLKLVIMTLMLFVLIDIVLYVLKLGPIKNSGYLTFKIPLLLVVSIVHEFCHGLFVHGGPFSKNVKYGFKFGIWNLKYLPVFYTKDVSGIPYSRNRALCLFSAPFFVINTFAIIMMYFGFSKPHLYDFIMLNAAGSAMDALYFCYMVTVPKNTFVHWSNFQIYWSHDPYALKNS